MSAELNTLIFKARIYLTTFIRFHGVSLGLVVN